VTSIPNASGIYRIIHLASGKSYIGSTMNLRKRRSRHFHELHQGIHKNAKLQRAWAKYGPDAFCFEILELVLIPELLTAREQFWFRKLRPEFNIMPTAGSPLGVKRSQETRAKMSAARMGKPNYFIGGHTPETAERIRLAHVGKTVSEESRANNRAAHMKISLIVTAPDGTEYLIHGVSQFCREHHLDPSSLTRAAHGRAKGKAYTQHKGYKARFLQPDVS